MRNHERERSATVGLLPVYLYEDPTWARIFSSSETRKTGAPQDFTGKGGAATEEHPWRIGGVKIVYTVSFTGGSAGCITLDARGCN